MICLLCGLKSDSRHELGEHLANEHTEAWEMAVSVIALQLLGVPDA